MGTIASVLQWSCTNCNVINPTESLKCLNCGTVRKVCGETLKYLDGDESMKIVKDLNINDGGNWDPAIPGGSKSPSNLPNKCQQQPFQVTPISNQALEIERDKTLTNNRFVC